MARKQEARKPAKRPLLQWEWLAPKERAALLALLAIVVLGSLIRFLRVREAVLTPPAPVPGQSVRGAYAD